MGYVTQGWPEGGKLVLLPLYFSSEPAPPVNCKFHLDPGLKQVVFLSYTSPCGNGSVGILCTWKEPETCVEKPTKDKRDPESRVRGAGRHGATFARRIPHFQHPRYSALPGAVLSDVCSHPAHCSPGSQRRPRTRLRIHDPMECEHPLQKCYSPALG